VSEQIFIQLSIVLAVVAVVSYFMKQLKQPLIVGYILSGFIIGPTAFNLANENEAFSAFSKIGVTLLLFIIGLELSLETLKKLGRPVFAAASATFLFVGLFGFLVASAFNFGFAESLIVGLALFFSSTIIIAKVLSDKKETNRLNGQIAIGVILLEDIVATFALLFIAANQNESIQPVELVLLTVKGVIFLAALLFFANKFLPRFTKTIAKSQELLFVFALAWGFGVASVFTMIGFSIEIGALFAGVALAQLPYVHEIGARLKPLRDFFIILFFIGLGSNISLDNLASSLFPALILSAVVLIMKPLVVMMALGILGYTRRTSFKTAINLSQISEFSIILVVLAASVGLVSSNLVSIITIVALVSITISTYFMQYDNAIYARIQKKLQFFERSGAHDSRQSAKTYPLVLVGYSNGGGQYVETFRSLKKRYVVIDYNPEIIDDLQRLGIDYLYGDVTDPELLAEINISSVKLIVNTVGDHEVNKSMVSYLRRKNSSTVIVCYSSNYSEASELYALGASYVMLPHFIGSERLNSFISSHGISRGAFNTYREKHMVKIGHTAVRHHR
jgi:Kef-type K+ transport system membrane component KefB/voltage-gated potassium channel Kch